MTRAERLVDKLRAMRPARREDLQPMTDACDAIVLHLWQAVQLAIDLAVAECAARGLATPSTYAAAFRALGDAAVLDPALVDRLVRATGFRNAIAHAYEALDLRRVWDAATEGPADLRAFASALARA